MANQDYQKEVAITGPFMDTKPPPSTTPQGLFSRLVGVDGRYTHCLRKFPGFKYYTTIGVPGASATYADVTFTQSGATIASQNGDFEALGFIATGQLCYVSGSTLNSGRYQVGLVSGGTITITAALGLANEAAGETVTISQAYDGSDILWYGDGDDRGLTWMKTDVTTAQGEIYFFNGTSTPARQDGTAMGPATLTGEAAAPASASQADSGGFLSSSGKYRVAYRWYNSTNKVRCGLSAILELAGTDIWNIVGGTDHLVTITLAARPDTSYDFVEIFRTANLDNPLDAHQGGVFYLEQTVANGGAYTVGTLHDTALVMQRPYNPWNDPVMDPPLVGYGHYYRGSIFTSRRSNDNAGVGLLWTNPSDESVEEFGSEYSYDGVDGDDSVKLFVESEDGLYAFAGGAAYFVNKTGGAVAIDRILEGKSAASAHSALAIGRKVYILTDSNLIIFMGGQVQYVTAVDRILQDEWMAGGGGAGDTMADTYMVYDGKFNCVFILNTTLKSMICLWETTQAVTLLEGCPFVSATYGLDISETTDAYRAYFVTASGRVVIPDDTQQTWANMTGESALTYANSQVTVGAGGDSGGTALATSCDDYMCVYCISGTHKGVWGYCDTTNIKYVPPWGSAASNINLLEGDVWVKSPVVFKARFAPYQGNRTTSQGYPTNSLFGRKGVKDIGLKVENISTSGSVDPTFRVGIFRDKKATPLTTANLSYSGTVDVVGNPSDDHVTMGGEDGVSVQAYVEQASTGAQFELTAIQITGTLSMSDHVE